MRQNHAIWGQSPSIHQHMGFGKIGSAEGQLEVIHIDDAAQIP